MRMLSLAIVIAACSHDARPVVRPPPVHPAPVATGTVGWPTWTHEQKLAYMKSTVMPRARELFATWMPVRFAKMDCETCHGAGARDGTYKMPNPDLPKLVGAKAGFQELADHEHETLKFMQATLVPEMAKLLGYQPFDMEKHVGFSCYQCHVQAGIAE